MEEQTFLNSNFDRVASTVLMVLERLASGSGIELDRARARRSLTELIIRSETAKDSPDQSPARLMTNVAEQLELRVDETFLTITEVRKTARQGSPLTAYAVTVANPGGWLIVQESGWRRLRVWTLDKNERWVTVDELRSMLGAVSSEQSLAWYSVQTGTQFNDASAAESQYMVEAASHHANHSHHAHLSPLRRLYRMLRPERGEIGIVTLFSAVVGLLALATPIAVESLVNTVAFGRFVQPLVVICGMLLTLLGFAAAIKLLQSYIAELIQRRLFVRVVSDLSFRLPRVQQTAMDQEHGPELMNRFFDVMTVQKSAALLVLDGIAIAIQMLIGMAVLAFYHPLLFGFDVFLVLSLTFAILVLGRGAVASAIAESKAKYSVAAWLEELARLPTTFKAADGPRRAIELADRLSSKYVAARRQHFHVLLRQIGFMLGLQAVSGSLLLGIGGWLVLQGQLTLGQLVAAEMIVATIVGSFAKLGKHMESFYDLLAAVDKVGHLLDLPMERLTGEVAMFSDAGAAITARDVSLPTPEGMAGGLNHVNLQIRSGEIVALVGPPGSGKSLLLDVLYGLREPEHGYATIDGVDVRSLQLASLRREVMLVRSVDLFPGSVAENVHMDRDAVGGVAVRQALREVGLLDEVLALPSGLDTPLTQLGMPLSLSQASRLMFARALAKTPRLLLIDGLADGLSDESLPVVMAALRRTLPRCTVVIATGRDDVIQFCDRRAPLNSPTGDDGDDNSLESKPTIKALAC